jgi:hypothetical protein
MYNAGDQRDRKIKLELFGKTYLLRTDESDRVISDAVTEIERLFSEVDLKFGPSVQKKDKILVVALQLAVELQKLKNEKSLSTQKLSFILDQLESAV